MFLLLIRNSFIVNCLLAPRCYRPEVKRSETSNNCIGNQMEPSFVSPQSHVTLGCDTPFSESLANQIQKDEEQIDDRIALSSPVLNNTEFDDQFPVELSNVPRSHANLCSHSSEIIGKSVGGQIESLSQLDPTEEPANTNKGLLFFFRFIYCKYYLICRRTGRSGNYSEISGNFCGIKINKYNLRNNSLSGPVAKINTENLI